MVNVTPFVVFALSVFPSFTYGAHISGHHRAIAARANTKACRDKVVPEPVKPIVKNAIKEPASAGKPASSTKGSSTSTKSSTKSASASTSTSTGKGSSNSTIVSGTPVKGGSASKLFPMGSGGKNAWSTSVLAADALPLSISTLHPFSVDRKNVATFTSAPDGSKAIRADYPAGSYDLGKGGKPNGFSIYAAGPHDFDGRTVTFAYSVMFDENFDFGKGGKMPGLFGGGSDDSAMRCSGGRHGDCFSTRFMWRKDGCGELYAYFPLSETNNKAFRTIPGAELNPTYGASVGRCTFKFERGKWATLAQRVKLNTPGKADGQVEIFKDGKSIFTVDKVILRTSQSGQVRGIQFQTFCGGHDPTWAPKHDSKAWFKDVTVATFD